MMADTQAEISERLGAIVEEVRDEFTEMNALRDETLNRSRALIRICATAIRAIHRHEWDEAEAMLEEARAAALDMVEPLVRFPALYHAGYTQDALKELVEAYLVYSVVRGVEPPNPDDLYVSGSTYLRGMSEAATEMRRFVLDLMRRGQVVEAEPYLAFMDDVYSLLDHGRFSGLDHERAAPQHGRASHCAGAHAGRPDDGHSPGPDAPGAACV